METHIQETISRLKNNLEQLDIPEHPEDGADVVFTRYLKGSKVLSKEDVIAEVGDKVLQGSGAPVYNIKFENIVSIG